MGSAYKENLNKFTSRKNKTAHRNTSDDSNDTQKALNWGISGFEGDGIPSREIWE